MHFYHIFAESLDTFRVFENLKAGKVGERVDKSPKTIWQILNHLIIWQKYQLEQLTHPGNETTFNESISWISEKIPASQQELNHAVQRFYTQIEKLKELLCLLTLTDSMLELKLTIIQNMTSHLAFHVGEVIHLRRILGEYPQPEQMQEFLQMDK